MGKFPHSTAWHTLNVSIFNDYSPLCVFIYYVLWVFSRWVHVTAEAGGRRRWWEGLPISVRPPFLSPRPCHVSLLLSSNPDSLALIGIHLKCGQPGRPRTPGLEADWYACPLLERLFLSVSGQVNFSQSWHWWQLSPHLFKWNGWMHLLERERETCSVCGYNVLLWLSHRERPTPADRQACN